MFLKHIGMVYEGSQEEHRRLSETLFKRKNQTNPKCLTGSVFQIQEWCFGGAAKEIARVRFTNESVILPTIRKSHSLSISPFFWQTNVKIYPFSLPLKLNSRDRGRQSRIESQETEAKSDSGALKGRAHTVQSHIHYSLAKLPCVVIKTQNLCLKQKLL